MSERRSLFLDAPLRQQVRRADDHGLHALLCAAHPEQRHPEWRHPERRAPRVPEADAVLGWRGPAGRPAPAQGAAREGHGGGEGGRSCLPHRYTTSLYRIAIPHRYTASLYHIAIPHRLRPSPAGRGDLPRGGQQRVGGDVPGEQQQVRVDAALHEGVARERARVLLVQPRPRLLEELREPAPEGDAARRADGGVAGGLLEPRARGEPGEGVPHQRQRRDLRRQGAWCRARARAWRRTRWTAACSRRRCWTARRASRS